jgi:polyhydroxyalkanoate synthesis regulator phasin
MANKSANQPEAPARVAAMATDPAEALQNQSVSRPAPHVWLTQEEHEHLLAHLANVEEPARQVFNHVLRYLERAFEDTDGVVRGMHNDLNSQLVQVRHGLVTLAREKANSTTVNEALDAKADTSQVAMLESRVQTLVDNLAAKADSAQVDALESRVDAVAGDLATKADHSNVTTLESRVQTLVDNLAAKADSAQVDALESRVQTLVDNLAAKADSAQVADLWSKIGTLHDQKADRSEVKDLESQVNKVEDALKHKANSSYVTVLESRVETLAGELATKADTTRVDALQNRVDAVAGDLGNKADNQEFQRLTKRIDGRSRIETLIKQQSRVIDLETLKSHLTSLKEELSASDIRLSRTQASAISGILVRTQPIIQNYREPDAVKKHEEVRRLVTEITRSIQTALVTSEAEVRSIDERN